MARAFPIWRLCLTTVNQGAGAPFVDRAYSTEIAGAGRRWSGFAIQLTPWRRNRFGDAIPQRALFIGWEVTQQKAPSLPPEEAAR